MDRKLERMTKQFPFLDRIVPAETVGNPTTIQFKVVRGDSSHMFWKADEVDGVNQTIWKSGRANRSGTRSEHIYLADGSGSWRVKTGDKPIIDILNDGRSGPDRWDAVVVAVNEHWHEEPTKEEEDKGIILGAFAESELTLFILQRPHEGWAALIANTDLLSNVSLNMKTIVDFTLREDPRFKALNDKLDSLAREFEHSVYEHGLREIIESSKVKGMSGQYGNVKLMTWVMCGRIMFTFQDAKGHDITLLGLDEGQLRAGVNSINATFDQAQHIIDAVIDVWVNASAEERVQLHHDDDEVRLF